MESFFISWEKRSTPDTRSVSNIKFAWIHAKVSWDQLESDPWIGETNLGSLFGDTNL